MLTPDTHARVTVTRQGETLCTVDMTLDATLDATGIAHAIQHAIAQATRPVPTLASPRIIRTDPILAA